MATIVEGEVEFEGIPVHYWEGGSGQPLLMIHGSGPGASTLGNWRLMLQPLAERYHILAVDLIGFGLSGRKSSQPYFDLGLWQRQAAFMLGRLPGETVNILGHSISGALALKLAATEARVGKVMTTGTMGVSFPCNRYSEMVWTFPETREALQRTAQCLIWDHSVITDEYLDGRMKVLHSPGYGDYFRQMFAGDKQRIIDAAALSDEEFARITCPVLLVHGRDDLPIPYEQTTLEVAKRLPHADVVGLARCSHSPALEHPQKLLGLAAMHFG